MIHHSAILSKHERIALQTLKKMPQYDNRLAKPANQPQVYLEVPNFKFYFTNVIPREDNFHGLHKKKLCYFYSIIIIIV